MKQGYKERRAAKHAEQRAAKLRNIQQPGAVTPQPRMIPDEREEAYQFELPWVGNARSQAIFLRENNDFVSEYPKLRELVTKIFVREMPDVSDEDLVTNSSIPEDSLAVAALDDNMTAEELVFCLGRIAVDDFEEILTLAGNGLGFGAHKIVRGMYERVVTAKYIARNPSKARIFDEQFAIDTSKLWNRTVAAFPEWADKVSAEDLRHLKELNDAARKKLKSVCPKCTQPLPDSPWTRKGIDVIAKEVDDELYLWYGQLYLEGTAQSHANSMGIRRRLTRTNSGWAYKASSEDQGRAALLFGHMLLLKVLELQNEVFHLGLEAELLERDATGGSIWERTRERVAAQKKRWTAIKDQKMQADELAAPTGIH